MLKGIFNQAGESSKHEASTCQPTFQQRVGIDKAKKEEATEVLVSEMIEDLGTETEESSFGKVFEKLSEVVPTEELNKETGKIVELVVEKQPTAIKEVVSDKHQTDQAIENQEEKKEAVVEKEVKSAPVEDLSVKSKENSKKVEEVKMDESQFELEVDEWELFMLTEGLKLLMKANENRFYQLALDEEIQIRQENQRLAFMIQQFEIKRLGKKRALKQMMNRLCLQLDEAQTEQDLNLVLARLNHLTEVFE